MHISTEYFCCSNTRMVTHVSKVKVMGKTPIQCVTQKTTNI